GHGNSHVKIRCPPGEAGKSTPSAPPLNLRHSSSQLCARPRVQPKPRGSMLLTTGRASLRPPDGNSCPTKTQGGAVEPPRKSARRSHVEIMSSTVSRFSQAPHSYVLT